MFLWFKKLTINMAKNGVIENISLSMPVFSINIKSISESIYAEKIKPIDNKIIIT